MVPPHFDDYRCVILGGQNLKKKGGGVSIYVKKKCISYYVVDDYFVMRVDVECLITHAGHIISLVIYRPPAGSKSDFCFVLRRLARFSKLNL